MIEDNCTIFKLQHSKQQHDFRVVELVCSQKILRNVADELVIMDVEPHEH